MNVLNTTGNFCYVHLPLYLETRLRGLSLCSLIGIFDAKDPKVNKSQCSPWEMHSTTVYAAWTERERSLFQMRIHCLFRIILNESEMLPVSFRQTAVSLMTLYIRE